MSRRETRSTAAAAAVAVAGDNSEDGSNNKRKRDDDNENDLLEDDDGRNNNNGAAEPEAVLSLDQGSDDEDDIDIDVPDGEFPSAFQLGRMLTLVEAVPAGKFDDESYNRMTMLKKWTFHGRRKEDSERWARFKLDFLMLGGLLRMIYLIERHMNEYRVVRMASVVSASLVYSDNTLDDDTKIQMRAAATFAVRSGALRTLLLASEEFIPSSDSKHWFTAQWIWRATARIWDRTSLEDTDPEILLPFIEANIVEQCLLESDKCVSQKANVACGFAGVVTKILSACPDFVTVVRENRMMDYFREVCDVYMDVISNDRDRANEILNLCRVSLNVGVLSSDDTKKWLLFVTTALSRHLTDNQIEKKAHSFVDRAVDKINHRELENTPLMDTLFWIIKSNNTPEELKTKYRALMTKMLS
mmetsp:Transcript_62204/g.151684  ORF Transcript_62204/g.151684 Transcript_62204/m.151684 type:complete len:415 (+) Transcript_62204:104-1348(+)